MTLDEFVIQQNTVRVKHFTKPVNFKSNWDKIKAKLHCIKHKHQWEYDSYTKHWFWGYMECYRCKCCGKTMYVFDETQLRKRF